MTIRLPSPSNPGVWLRSAGQVEIRENPISEPADGEVLVRTRRTLISTGTELSLYAADRARPGSTWADLARFPLACGYSHAGEVEAVGPGVDRRWIGRRVATRARHAAFVTWPVSDVRRIPDSVSFEEATFATLAAVCMNGCRRVGLTWGESVAVFGLGIIGQLFVRIAAATGCHPLFVSERSERRVSLLPPGGRIHVLDWRDEGGWLKAIRHDNDDRGVDVVVEATAVASLIPKELGVLRDQGRMLLLSSPHGDTTLDMHDLCNRRSLHIVGAHGFSHPPVATLGNPWTSQRHGEIYLEWVASGLMETKSLVTHHFPYSRASEGYELLAERRGEALGVILDWN